MTHNRMDCKNQNAACIPDYTVCGILQLWSSFGALWITHHNITAETRGFSSSHSTHSLPLDGQWEYMGYCLLWFIFSSCRDCGLIVSGKPLLRVNARPLWLIIMLNVSWLQSCGWGSWVAKPPFFGGLLLSMKFHLFMDERPTAAAGPNPSGHNSEVWSKVESNIQL